MTSGNESNHGRRCRCREPRLVLRDIIIDDADHSDESNGKKDSIQARNAENAHSSESEDEKPESVVCMASIGKSDVENESSLNLRLASDAEGETGANRDVNEARQDSTDTGNAYFQLRILTQSTFRELHIKFPRLVARGIILVVACLFARTFWEDSGDLRTL